MSGVGIYAPPGGVQEFRSAEFKSTQAKLDALIAYAAEVKDWPLLEEAIDAKLDQQSKFCAWWEQTVRRKGGERWVDNAERGYQVPDAERDTQITQQQVSRWNKSLESPDQYRERLRLAAYRKAGLEPEENHRAEGTGENEWFTPAVYIEAAREVMGGIDLDPATHPMAQRTVQATEFYTKADDGLRLSWHSRVWLNPPYAQPFIAQFVRKLIAEYASGNVTQAIMLTHNYTDTAWFHEAEALAALLCFTRGRIKFVDINGGLCAPTQGQCFFYYGDRIDEFRRVFSAHGFVR